MNRVLIVGAGSFGTAMASLLAQKGVRSTLLCRRPELAEQIAATRENPTFLPGVKLGDEVTPFCGAPDLSTHDWCFCAVPTGYIRGTFSPLADRYPVEELPVVSLSKGIEHKTLEFPSEILGEVTGAAHVLVLSGPSHAEEVAKGLPASVVCAGDAGMAQALQQLVSNDAFRAYWSSDLIGVEVGGAAKNVVAIAAGIIDGLELGDNCKAALLSRGLAEIVRLGTAMKAEPRTFYGLSGVGDLYTTCASAHGRNRAFGMRIGRGEKPSRIAETMEMVSEGYYTAPALKEMARRHKVEMPIVDEVNRILFEDASPVEALTRLMTRELKAE